MRERRRDFAELLSAVGTQPAFDDVENDESDDYCEDNDELDEGDGDDFCKHTF